MSITDEIIAHNHYHYINIKDVVFSSNLHLKRHQGACAQLILLQFFSSICKTRRARRLETSKAKKGNNKKTFQKGTLIIQVLLGRNFNHLAVEPDKPNVINELAWPSWRLNWCPRKIGNDPNRYIQWYSNIKNIFLKTRLNYRLRIYPVCCYHPNTQRPLGNLWACLRKYLWA